MRLPKARDVTPWAILAVVVVFSLVGARLTWVAAAVRDHARFENAIGSTQDRIESRVQVYIDGLTTAAAYLAARPHATFEELGAFLRELAIPRRYRGVQGIGFAEQIEPSRLAERVAEMRAKGFPNFDVWPKEPRDSYNAIVMLEPLDRRNRAAIGYDMSTEPVRREAMERARDTGAPALSGRVELVQEIDLNKQPGFLIYVPIYGTAQVPQTVEERRRRLRGFLYAPFRAEDFLHGLFGREREPRVAVYIYDGIDVREDRRLAQVEPRDWTDPHPLFRSSATLTLAGTPWTIEFLSLPTFDASSGRPVAWGIGLIGCAIGLLLFGLTRAQEASRRAAERTAEERRRSEERLRTITDTLPVLVAYIDQQERYRFVNGTYRAWFDREPGQVEGRHMADVLGKEAYDALRPNVQAALSGEVQSFTSELPYVTGKRHVHVEYMPHRVDGKVVGFISHVTDVTAAAHAAQERLDLLERERKARAEAETLNRIGRSLAAELDTEKLVQLITDESTRITGAEFGAFFRNAVDEKGQHYLLHTLSGALRDHFDHLPPPRATELFSITFHASSPSVRLDDVRGDPRFGRNPPYNGLPPGHLPVVSYLAVPVVSSSGEVFGGLFFGHSQPGRFTEEHERIVMGIAGQASIALDNARLYEAAKEADRRKDEFLAMLAHELRNPLAPIVTSLQVMRMDGGVETGARARDVIERQVQRMVRLVDDLLDVSRITRGKIQLRHQTLDLRSVAEHAIEATRGLMVSRSHRLHMSLPPAPVVISADPVRIEQVLTNLLDNAAKYTEPGGDIWITVRTEDGCAVAEVRDTGIGIARASLPQMFDLFAQAERSLDRSAGGLGIGLTLVRRLVELHGGSVEAASDGVRQGSTFIVRLPLAEQLPVAVSTPALAAPHPSGSRRLRILLVDDNPDITSSLEELLARLGHQTRAAGTGPAALEIARDFAPHLVLLDLGLPGMSGYEVAQRIRRQPDLAGVRIVAVSGYAQESDREQARKAGFDDHLAKPVDFDRLEAILREV